MTTSNDQNFIGLTTGTVDNKDNKIVKNIIIYRREDIDGDFGSYVQEVERPFNLEDACSNFTFNN
jgi:hypothetical protein